MTHTVSIDVTAPAQPCRGTVIMPPQRGHRPC